MSQLPTPASSRPLLLRGATILCLDAGARVLRGWDLAVRDGRIDALAPRIEPPEGAEVLDLAGHWLLPGLVQGHVHLGQTFFRGLAEDRRLLAWLRERIWPLEAAHDDESAYWCGLLGAAECLLTGTTTVQDIGIGPGTAGLLSAIADSGLRGFAGLCLMDVGDGLPARLRQETDAALAAAVEHGERLERATGGRVRPVLNPRFILSCSDALWTGLREIAARRGWPVHTHALEQREEGDAVRALKGGRDEIDYFDEVGLLEADLRLAHGVWLEEGHLRRVARRRVSVVHCPSSNLKLASGIADIVGIRRHGVPVGLGCDGAACSNRLDALAEARLAALLQRLRHGPTALSGLTALRLATSEGARALGLDGEVGSLEVGKRADLLVLRPGHPELWAAPQADPHDVVLFGASPLAVRHVFVDGVAQVTDGALTRLDLGRILERATAAWHDLARRALGDGLDLRSSGSPPLPSGPTLV